MSRIATRLEKVVLDIESNLAPVMQRDAAAAALLKRELNSLSGTAVRGTSRDLDNIGTSADKSGKQIDRLSGRLVLLAKTAAILGPALVPIGAVAVPAITGLAAQFGAAALAGGTAIIAFQGVGTALEAVNKAALEPTVANLEAAKVAMQAIGPEARAFVTEIQAMIPALQGVRNAAAAGLFPGLTESLGELESMLPRVEQIVFAIGNALGGLAADGAASLAGPRWADFLSFIETEIPSALTVLGQTIGNLTHGLAEMWMAFTPLNNDFASWMLDASEAFDKWSQGLAETDGFQEFVDYIRENGPRVADALGSIGNAVLQIVEASAPLGGPILKALTLFADAIGAIADSDLGTPIMAAVAAMSAYSLATRAATAANLSFANSSLLSWGQTKALGVGVGALALSMTDLDDKAGLSNTAMLALLGTMAGPWGAAAGAAAGFALDFAAANDDMEASIRAANSALDSGNLDQQAAALANLNVATDEASAGFLDLGNVTGLIANPIDAAKSSFNLLSGSTGDARAKIDQLNRSLYGGTVGFGALKVHLDGTAKAASGWGTPFDKATRSAYSFANAIERVNATLSKRASFRDYEAALDDFAKTLDKVKDKARLLTKAGKIDITIPKGREVQAQLDNIASTAVKVAENLKGMDRQRYLERARADFIASARQLGLTRAAARELANELGLLDKERANPKIELDGWANAIANANGVKSAIDRIQSKTVFVNVLTRRSSEGGGTGLGPVDYASGGYTGAGRKYEAAGIVHRGEVVLPQEDVKRDWAMLKARYGHLPGMAGGGLAGSKMSDIRGDYGLMGFARAVGEATDASGQVAYGFDQITESHRKHLEQRKKMLTEEIAAHKQRLDALRQERQALKDSIADLITGGDLFTVTGPKDTSGMSEELQAIYAANPELQGGVTSNLDSMIAAGQERLRLIKKLKRMGLSGAALAYIATQPIEILRELASSGRGTVNLFEQQYNQLQGLGNQAGQFTGNAVFGQAIREQVKEVKQSNAYLKRIEAELKAIRKENKQNSDSNAQKSGKALAGAVNNSISNVARSR